MHQYKKHATGLLCTQSKWKLKSKFINSKEKPKIFFLRFEIGLLQNCLFLNYVPSQSEMQSLVLSIFHVCTISIKSSFTSFDISFCSEHFMISITHSNKSCTKRRSIIMNAVCKNIRESNDVSSLVRASLLCFSIVQNKLFFAIVLQIPECNKKTSPISIDVT